VIEFCLIELLWLINTTYLPSYLKAYKKNKFKSRVFWVCRVCCVERLLRLSRRLGPGFRSL